MGVPPDRFEARFAKSLRAAVDAARLRLRGS
jgi:hypothetical protein